MLPVGGIKDKVLAAHRSGIKMIILPERNRKDLPDIPESVRSQLAIHFATRIDDVLALALDGPFKRERVTVPPAGAPPASA